MQRNARRIARGTRWPDYRAIWRWHFYAGLLCLPLVCWLACTGAIYLFRPQIEAWLDRPYANIVTSNESLLAPSAEVQAALDAFPGATLHAYQLPASGAAAPQLLIGRGDTEWRIWLHPMSGQVLKAAPEDERLMNVIFSLHGELLLGNRGSMLVELAASWAIVLVLTGLVLWWPRGASRLGGLVYPRFCLGRTIFWRDLHAVAGLWMSLPVLFLLVSGLPWAANWGAYLDELRQLSGQVTSRRDWPVGNVPAPGMVPVVSRPLTEGDYAAVDRVVAAASGMHLDWPVLVSPPEGAGADWTVRSDTQDRPRREVVLIDGRTGTVVARSGFNQQDWVDRAVAVAVAAHEGQLFGWPNQAAGLLTAVLLLMASVSAGVHWWLRRPHGVLGALQPIVQPRFVGWLVGVIVLLGLMLPLFGLSLVAVLATERLVLTRLPASRRWLGLRARVG